MAANQLPMRAKGARKLVKAGSKNDRAARHGTTAVSIDSATVRQPLMGVRSEAIGQQQNKMFACTKIVNKLEEHDSDVKVDMT